MSDLDDDQDMRRIDERLLAGEPVPEDLELTALVAAVRSLADAPAPLPTPALAQVLSEGLPVDAPLPFRRRGRRSTLAKIALGAAVAAAAATGAAALDIPESVREPARSFFSGVADLFTPWDSGPQPQPTPQPSTGGPSEPAVRPQNGAPTQSPDPADRTEDPGERPETPAGPTTPQPSGNPDVNPGLESDPGQPADPEPPSETGRNTEGSQKPAENPYPTSGRLR